MPAFPQLSSETNTIYTFLAGGGGAGIGRGGANSLPLTGPVVANGGAPGGLEPALNEQQLRARYGNNNRFVGPPYPAGVAAPEERLYSDYGLVQGVIAPPWSEIVAYDLNKGSIRWRKALGEDEEAVKAGGKNTGMLAGGERVGMVVTGTGLVFVTAKDGKLRAFDADNGDEVWTYKMPAGLIGLPSMYEVGGRQYLVVGSGPDPVFGFRRGGRGGFGAAGGGQKNQGYIAFALPKD